MGAAYFIALERKIDGLDTMMDGKNLSRHIETLDTAARQAGVRPLSEFFSVTPEQASEFMEGEGMDAGDIDLPPLQQFSVQDGLKSVKELLSRPEAKVALQDLQDCERILKAAEQHQVKWHFEIDI